LTYEEKLDKLERTLDNAVAAALTPTNINTDSILSVPEQLFTDSLRLRDHDQVCVDHSMGQLYSRGPTPITMDSENQYTALRKGASAPPVDVTGRTTPTLCDRSGRTTPVVTDTDSKYSYVPLRHATLSSIVSVERNRTPLSTYSTSDKIIRELGLHNTETSPPRWYNPPPEKLNPTPEKLSEDTHDPADHKSTQKSSVK